MESVTNKILCVLRLLKYAFLFALMWFCLEYLILRFTPDYVFLEMYSIEPLQKVYKQWDELSFETFAEYKKNWLITRYDTLYCDIFGLGNYLYYSQYISTKKLLTKTVNNWWDWVYQAKTPSWWVRCYLHNTTTLDIGYWLYKKDTAVTWPFIFE